MSLSVFPCRLAAALSVGLALPLIAAPAVSAKNTDATPEQRAADLVAHMSREEKVAQAMNDAPAIPRLGIPAYEWWSEGLHGIARNGYATVFPQAIGLAASWNTHLMQQVGTVVSTEARAKFNQAGRPGKDHKRYAGLTIWSPNINIFR
ncbi:glycoside hydrolase family 3 N-terminal domain-containing protein, partial [Xanthomonas oryzae]